MPAASKPDALPWPRPYILDLHERALAEGCFRVPVTSEAQAKSLIASFHRIRRRGDSQHKLGFIRPEYHLITAYYESARGTVLFVYDRLPVDHDIGLPQPISIPDSEKIARPVATLAAAPNPVALAKAEAVQQLDDAGIDEAIEALAANAAKRAARSGPPEEL